MKTTSANLARRKTMCLHRASRFLLSLLIAAFTGVVPGGCAANSGSDALRRNLADLKVGMYVDRGIWEGTDAETGAMLKAIMCPFVPVTREAIVNGDLRRFDIFLMPGGDMWEYHDYLGPKAMKNIRDFVTGGGGYIGVCGGAYLAAEIIVWKGWAGQSRMNMTNEGLNLFSGTAQGPISDFAPSYKDTDTGIRILMSGHPITALLPAVIKPVYDHGPEFIPADQCTVSAIGRTVRGDKLTVIAFTLGSGRVFLTGLHPEKETGRSSWPMVGNAILWCAKRDNAINP